MAGGKYGIAPVFASSVTYEDGMWKVNRRFDTAGAMHASNEMIWLHNDEINGFPTVDLSKYYKSAETLTHANNENISVIPWIVSAALIGVVVTLLMMK